MGFKYSRLLIYLEGLRTYGSIETEREREREGSGGNANWPPQNNYTVMVRFPQITLREWIRSFLRLMKLIERVRSEHSVCEVERTFFFKIKRLLTELRSRLPPDAADPSVTTAVPDYNSRKSGGLTAEEKSSRKK